MADAQPKENGNRSQQQHELKKKRWQGLRSGDLEHHPIDHVHAMSVGGNLRVHPISLIRINTRKGYNNSIASEGGVRYHELLRPSGQVRETPGQWVST